MDIRTDDDSLGSGIPNSLSVAKLLLGVAGLFDVKNVNLGTLYPESNEGTVTFEANGEILLNHNNMRKLVGLRLQTGPEQFASFCDIAAGEQFNVPGVGKHRVFTIWFAGTEADYNG